MKILLSLVILLMPTAPQSGLTSDQEKFVQKLVAVHKNWGVGTNTAGASVQIVEDQRAGKKGRMRAEAGYTVIHFLMQTSGLPKDQIYNLLNLPFPKLVPQISLQGLGINADGIVICPGKPNTCSSEEGPDDPVDLVLPSAKGEAHHLALVSKDGKTKAMFTVIPFPAHAENNGCSLDVVRLMPMGALFFAQAKGLPPNTEVEFEGNSESEVHAAKVTADSLGKYETILLPAVKGKESGTLHVAVATPACKVSADIDWGKGSDRPE